MDEQTLFARLYQIIAVFLSGAVSFFIYRQKKLHDNVEYLDDKLDKIELSQVSYNKSVDYLIQRFDRVENNIEELLKRTDRRKTRR